MRLLAARAAYYAIDGYLPIEPGANQPILNDLECIGIQNSGCIVICVLYAHARQCRTWLDLIFQDMIGILGVGKGDIRLAARSFLQGSAISLPVPP